MQRWRLSSSEYKNGVGSPLILRVTCLARSCPISQTFHGITMHRGEVWWADIPGDERRPILILTRERFIPRLTSLLVAPITTTVRDIPTEVELDEADGMPVRSAINFDNTFTLGVDRFVEPLAALSEVRMEQACAAYRFAAGC